MQITNNLAGRLVQGYVAMELAMSGAFRVVEESYPFVRFAQPGHDVSGFVWHPVADNKQLKILKRLPLCGFDGVLDQSAMIVRWDKDGCMGH